jgi:hypothetical protein
MVRLGALAGSVYLVAIGGLIVRGYDGARSREP